MSQSLMGKCQPTIKEIKKIPLEKCSALEQMLTLLKEADLRDLDSYIIKFLERKVDKHIGLSELDNLITSIYNFSFNLSLNFKQNYLLRKQEIISTEDLEYYSKQDVAKMFRVNIRTVSNWIKDGLEATEIGGVIRIGKGALKSFVGKDKTKKFNWKSIARVKNKIK